MNSPGQLLFLLLSPYPEYLLGTFYLDLSSQQPELCVCVRWKETVQGFIGISLVIETKLLLPLFIQCQTRRVTRAQVS